MPVLLRSCVDSDPVTRTSGKALGFSMLESRLSLDMMVAGAVRKSLRQSALCLASDGNFSAILPKHYKVNRVGYKLEPKKRIDTGEEVFRNFRCCLYGNH